MHIQTSVHMPIDMSRCQSTCIHICQCTCLYVTGTGPFDHDGACATAALAAADLRARQLQRVSTTQSRYCAPGQSLTGRRRSNGVGPEELGERCVRADRGSIHVHGGTVDRELERACFTYIWMCMTSRSSEELPVERPGRVWSTSTHSGLVCGDAPTICRAQINRRGLTGDIKPSRGARCTRMHFARYNESPTSGRRTGHSAA